MKVHNIKWAITDQEIFEKLDKMSAEDAAESLEMYLTTYSRMPVEERHAMAERYFNRWHYDRRADFMGLPLEVKLDRTFDKLNNEDIINWLSQKYNSRIHDCEIIRI